jgi:hypothetical protein
MSKFFIRMTAVIVTAGLVLAACANPSGGGGSGNNSGGGGGINGTYTGKINTADATLTITATKWTLSAPGANVNESGTYSVKEGTATLLASDGTKMGTATLSGDTLTVTPDDKDRGGPYTFKKSGNNDNDNDNNNSGNSGNNDNNSGNNGNSGSSIVGTYTGTISGTSALLTVTASGWTLAVPNANVNKSGTYSVDDGGTATLKSGETVFGTAALDGTKLTVTPAGKQDGGPYTFTKSGGNNNSGNEWDDNGDEWDDSGDEWDDSGDEWDDSGDEWYDNGDSGDEW